MRMRVNWMPMIKWAKYVRRWCARDRSDEYLKVNARSMDTCDGPSAKESQARDPCLHVGEGNMLWAVKVPKVGFIKCTGPPGVPAPKGTPGGQR